MIVFIALAKAQYKVWAHFVVLCQLHQQSVSAVRSQAADLASSSRFIQVVSND